MDRVQVALGHTALSAFQACSEQAKGRALLSPGAERSLPFPTPPHSNEVSEVAKRGDGGGEAAQGAAGARAHAVRGRALRRLLPPRLRRRQQVRTTPPPPNPPAFA